MRAILTMSTKERVKDDQTEQEREVTRVLERGRHIIRTLLRHLQDGGQNWHEENGGVPTSGKEAIAPYLAALVNLGYAHTDDDGLHYRLTEAGRQRLTLLDATNGGPTS
ncbi:MAG TPA: hypothetical protein VLA99_00875 [Nitrospiraceae bacterium]|nr:hypothetical protein [Nitrospiraceae bacterium]